MSDSVRPHRRQPTRLPRPWDSPGKNTEVGCHFLLQCMKVKSESEVAQSCPTLRDPLDCSPPGCSVRGIFQQEDCSGAPWPSPFVAVLRSDPPAYTSPVRRGCSLMVLSLFTELCHRCHSRILENFCHPQRNACSPIAFYTLSPLP